MRVDVSTLRPRGHEAPDGWPAEVFERVTDAIAAALVSAYKRQGTPRVEMEAAR